MKRRTKILTAASAAAIALAGVVVLAADPPGALAHGGWGRHGGHKVQMICSEARNDRLAAITATVETFVGFTDAQAASWQRLKAALEAGSARIGQACENPAAQSRPETAPGHLERMELALATGLDVIQEVRPAFEDLYAKLSDEQRARIDELLSRRGPRH